MSNNVAAIWARISTEPQQSILKVDWTSLDLFRCPMFQKLRGWINRREIGALGILDRDRLNAIGLQRLVFLSECKENGVEMVICQGPPILDEPEGQLVELALALGKERQVLRAQQGSKDALRERATVKGLPTTCQAPYGYDWDESRNGFAANSNWENRSLIINLFLAGATLKGIVKELHKRGIPSPKGKEWWVEPTLSLILKDTVNFGEYRALRRESIEPQQRRGNTYGKTSSRHLSGVPLHNIMVERPVITKAQYDWIMDRLEKSKLNARRNGHRDYLLRGLIHYEGDHLRYYGQNIRGESWAYRYYHRGQRNGNPRTYLPGRKLEAQVEAKARDLLTSNDVLERELGWREEAIQQTVSRFEDELKRLDRKRNENINAESELVSLKIRGNISDEAYTRQQSLLIAERQWLAEENERIEGKLADLNKQSVSLVGLEQLRGQMEEKLASTEFADRRFILEALRTKVMVTTDGAIEVEFTIGGDRDTDGAIVLNSPLNACPRYSVVLCYNPLLAIR